MFTVLTGCEKCPEAQCKMVRHEDIDIDVKFVNTMDCEQFINMMNKYFISCYYFNKHFMVEELLDKNDKRYCQTTNELKILSRAGPSHYKLYNALIKKQKNIIKEDKELRDEIYAFNREALQLFRLESRREREWKRVVREDWDMEMIRQKLPEPMVITSCDLHDHSDSQPGPTAIFPRAIPSINELFETSFKADAPRSDRVEYGMIDSPIKIDSPRPMPASAHALIKRTKFKYEYVVGTKDEVGSKVASGDIIFMEDLGHIRDDYLEKIHHEMKLVVINEPKRAITFNGNTFVYKKTPKTPLKNIINIYRTAHA